MQARALVPGRNVRKPVRGLEAELFDEADVHRRRAYGSVSARATKGKRPHPPREKRPPRAGEAISDAFRLVAA